jgi:ribonucleotide reductase beta subunit family protein with ferritin-like domain
MFTVLFWRCIIVAENSKDSLVLFLKNQIIIEKEIVDSLDKALADMKNPAVKGVLKGISLDSVKHAELYTSAVTLLSEVSVALTQDDLDTHRALIEKHIEIESKLITRLEAMMPTVDNEKVKFLLNSILIDERRHHAMLKVVLETIVHAETITEADWWKMLWENAPFHGAPGGG